jgi:hypothetical protein
MTAFCSHQHRLHELAATNGSLNASSSWIYAKRLRALVRRVVIRMATAFKIIEQAIETARIRRLAPELTPRPDAGDDRSLESPAYRNRRPDRDATKFPQRPLVLGDKWDF